MPWLNYAEKVTVPEAAAGRVFPGGQGALSVSIRLCPRLSSSGQDGVGICALRTHLSMESIWESP